ncbi:hypothetical protein HY994_02470 [Candidatus Micrarchaeota archaeon]|nr:hypothetical protein [Candidatus Micrarchaeota archaeon]
MTEFTKSSLFIIFIAVVLLMGCTVLQNGTKSNSSAKPSAEINESNTSVLPNGPMGAYVFTIVPAGPVGAKERLSFFIGEFPSFSFQELDRIPKPGKDVNVVVTFNLPSGKTYEMKTRVMLGCPKIYVGGTSGEKEPYFCSYGGQFNGPYSLNETGRYILTAQADDQRVVFMNSSFTVQSSVYITQMTLLGSSVPYDLKEILRVSAGTKQAAILERPVNLTLTLKFPSGKSITDSRTMPVINCPGPTFQCAYSMSGKSNLSEDIFAPLTEEGVYVVSGKSDDSKVSVQSIKFSVKRGVLSRLLPVEQASFYRLNHRLPGQSLAYMNLPNVTEYVGVYFGEDPEFGSYVRIQNRSTFFKLKYDRHNAIWSSNGLLVMVEKGTKTLDEKTNMETDALVLAYQKIYPPDLNATVPNG